MESMDWIISFLFSVLRLTTPIIFAALGACICKRAGFDNMAIESMMLSAALGGVLISGATQSAWIGFFGAILVGMLIGLFISYVSFIGKADLYLTNIAMNLTATGGTIFVLFIACGEKASSARAVKSMVMPTINIPIIQDIPFIGEIVSGHNILTYMAFVSVFVVHFFLYRTRMGLRLRSVGENPQAAESVGISSTKIKFIAFSISGALSAMGGIYLSMGYISSFVKNMTAGRGFIGLSANNIAGGSPVGGMLSALMFGIADATANAMQMANIPVDFVLMIPYATTILGLVLISIYRQRQYKKKIKRVMI